MSEIVMRDDRTNSRLGHWEAKTEWPLAVVAVVFLTAYSIEVLGELEGTPERIIDRFLFCLYILFAADYLLRLVLAEHRIHWFFRNLLDLVAVALPFLRPLRALRLVSVVGALQRALGGAIRGSVIVYSALTSILLVYVSSLAVLEAERSAANPDIRNFGDAVWWAISTITTVGYGEFYPVTFAGRMIAVLLMVGGISLIGTITASVAAWIVDRVAQEDSAHQAATVAHIAQLRAEIAELAKMIATQKDLAERGERPERFNESTQQVGLVADPHRDISEGDAGVGGDTFAGR